MIFDNFIAYYLIAGCKKEGKNRIDFLTFYKQIFETVEHRADKQEDKNGQTDIQGQTNTRTGRDRQTEGQTDRLTYRRINRQTGKQPDRQKDRQKDRRTHRQKDRQKERKTERKTERQVKGKRDRKGRQKDIRAFSIYKAEYNEDLTQPKMILEVICESINKEQQF